MISLFLIVFNFFVAQIITLFDTRGRVSGQLMSSTITENYLKNWDLKIPVVNRIVLYNIGIEHSTYCKSRNCQGAAEVSDVEKISKVSYLTLVFENVYSFVI